MAEMEGKTEDTEESQNYVFAMDIGTRSIIGMVGCVRGEKLCVLAVEKEEHSSRAMVDGQIEDIDQVAKVAKGVKEKLEKKTGFPLKRVYVAAAGRALKTQNAVCDLDLMETGEVTEEILQNLESKALSMAEEAFEAGESDMEDRQFYLVGYSIRQYYLDKYPIATLLGHKGKHLTADVIATFLPSEVVESLYNSMQKAGMEVAGMTLEPIASMNASIPGNLRLLNLVLVDIGAGTSDIAAAKDGSICGYTMATVAGDEITECLMKAYLVDFDTAERMKMQIGQEESVEFTDVLGFEQMVLTEELEEAIESTVQSLCKRIAEKIMEVNGTVPSAVFLAGGGSKLVKVREYVAQYLEMDLKRVALGGNNFSVHAYSDEYDLKDPEYSTPLGIAVSAGLNLINDSFYIRLNGQRAKLFRSGRLTVRDILMMNGYGFKHMMSRSGQSLNLDIDGERKMVYGQYAVPAKLLLNGEDAKISDMVHAGDEIEFEPAKNGEDAVACLGDVVSFKDRGSILVGKIMMPLGITATVNGIPAGEEWPLKSGDRIQTNRIQTVADLMEICRLDKPVCVNGSIAGEDWVLEPGDVVGEEAAAVKPEENLHFDLNDRELTLPLKPDGISYIVTEMLPHTNIDFTKPEGVILLKVNGEDAGFQTELKNYDKISISWLKKER